MSENARALAIFIDFENLALGFQNRRDRFDMTRVLERLVEKGKIVAKKAYADWSRFSSYTFMLHNSAIELVEIPRRGQSGKNSADIRLCVDAMDLAYSKDHIDTFVVVSGDSDFSPLVSKLKELGKHVIGLGMAESTSDLLRDNCDEFIYYEDLGRSEEIGPEIDANLPEQKRKVFALLIDALVALRRDNQGHIGSSTIKDTIKRKKPSFNESYHGYRSFSELLLDAQKAGLVELDVDKRSRTYVVTRFGAEMKLPQPAPESASNDGAESMGSSGMDELPLLGKRKSRRRRRGRNGNGNGNGHDHGPERTAQPGSGEGTRIRMSVPLPSGGKPPHSVPAAEPDEPEEEIDSLENDPRLDRIDELEEEEGFDFLDEPEPEVPAPRPAPAPAPMPAPRPQPNRQPAPRPNAGPTPKPAPRPAPQPAPAQARPAPAPQRPGPQPAPRPQPASRPAPAAAPAPLPRVINPSELPPPSDDEIFFSSGEPTLLPIRFPAPAPAPTSAPVPVPTPASPPRPRSQPVPVPREPVVIEPTTSQEPEDEAVESAEPAEPAEPTKKPAKPRKPAASKRGAGKGRGRKKPTEKAPGESAE